MPSNRREGDEPKRLVHLEIVCTAIETMLCVEVGFGLGGRDAKILEPWRGRLIRFLTRLLCRGLGYRSPRQLPALRRQPGFGLGGLGICRSGKTRHNQREGRGEAQTHQCFDSSTRKVAAGMS